MFVHKVADLLLSFDLMNSSAVLVAECSFIQSLNMNQILSKNKKDIRQTGQS